MNEKIREIVNNINEKYEDYYVQDIVSGKDLKIIADYIINLEEKLVISWDIRNKYLSRIYKAIDYINTRWYKDTYQELIDILRGDKE